MSRSAPFVFALALALALTLEGVAPAAAPQTPTPGAATFAQDLAFLQAHGDVQVLTAPTGARVAVSPKYQARVMTSAVEADGRSLGWINRPFIEAGRTGTPFDNYGGEDRFWLGPEGGQFGLYFPPGQPFVFSEWQTPAALQEWIWHLKSARTTTDHADFVRALGVTNHSGTRFTVEVDRRIRLLSDEQMRSHLGLDSAGTTVAGLKWVAFETENRITNRGTVAWSKDRGLLSVWVLGMYAPSPDANVVVPFEKQAEGPIVNDTYFGKVPADRLAVHDADGYLVFKCDGEYRSKIGVNPARAKSVLGSYSESARLLTLVQYDKPAGARDYVNSLWELQKEPYAGDAVNSYNDGPVAPGQPSLGGFYELETSSPAAALAPGQSLTHTHRTFHFVGDRALLDRVAERVLGVTATRITAGGH